MDTKPHVLLLEELTAGALAQLREHSHLHFAAAPDRGPELADQYPIRAIITRGKGRVDRDLIDRCPELEVVARAGVGLDNVAVDYATEKNVKVLNLPGSNAATVAEHTLGLMLGLQRQLHVAVREVKDGNWAFRHSYGGDELRGKTLGILGRGNIGTRVAALAEAFQMKVLFLARTRVQYEEQGSQERNLYELMEEADILSLHLPLTDRTHGLLSEKAFSRIKPGSLIVNTARGEIIDNEALLAALRSGRVGGYAADVMSKEQLAEAGDLIAHPNVLLTPHVASLTGRTFTDMSEQTVRNTLAILAGKTVPERYQYN